MHDAPISSLSHGYRQRVGVAQAMVHKPRLLILDEPTGGLDPVQIVEMRELIKQLKGEHTVLVSSHILSEISQICDRLLIIQQGKIVAQGSEAELADKFGSGSSGGAVEIELKGAASKALEVIKAVAGVKDVQVVKLDGELLHLRITAERDVRSDVVRAVVGANLDVLKLDRGASQLERIFLQLTHGQEPA